MTTNVEALRARHAAAEAERQRVAAELAAAEHEQALEQAHARLLAEADAAERRARELRQAAAEDHQTAADLGERLRALDARLRAARTAGDALWRALAAEPAPSEDAIRALESEAIAAAALRPVWEQARQALAQQAGHRTTSAREAERQAEMLLADVTRLRERAEHDPLGERPATAHAGTTGRS